MINVHTLSDPDTDRQLKDVTEDKLKLQARLIDQLTETKQQLVKKCDNLEKKINIKSTQKANLSKKSTKSDIKRHISSMQTIYVPKYLHQSAQKQLQSS